MTVLRLLVFGTLGYFLGFFLDWWIRYIVDQWLPAQGLGRLEQGMVFRQLRARYYDLVPWLNALLTAAMAGVWGLHAGLWGALMLLWGLLVLLFVDLETLLLPDALTLPLLWLGLFFNSFGLYTSAPAALWGAMAGYGSLWSVYWLHRRLTGRIGLGQGDFKLLAALGAWLGVGVLPALLLLASLSGILVMGALMLQKRGATAQTLFPFGPFLAFAGIGVMLWGKGGVL